MLHGKIGIVKLEEIITQDARVRTLTHINRPTDCMSNTDNIIKKLLDHFEFHQHLQHSI